MEDFVHYLDIIKHFIATWGYFTYITIFLCLALGIVGLPLPDEIGMTALGILASQKIINLSFTYLSAVLGSFSGITISFIIGKYLGYPIIIKYGSRFGFTEEKIKKYQTQFKKYGGWIIPIGYYVPGLRHFSAVIVGLSKMSFKKFACYAYPGAMFWCASFIGLGYYLGDTAIQFFETAHEHSLTIALVLISIISITFIIWYWSKYYIKKAVKR